mgnify:CR=1 FL=1
MRPGARVLIVEDEAAMRAALEDVLKGAGYRVLTAADGATGDVVETVARLVPSVEGLAAYVAGGETTIHRVRDLLVGKGMDRKSVRWERFW